ncbi:hypothetical protein CMI49_01740 [Candidatus Pacearchaeota archaeon]|nr:hypothetical protein [Candidatus Pacearchaeota archaeon]
MKINNKIKVGVIFLIGIFLISSFVSAYISSSTQYTAPGAGSFGYLSRQGIDIAPRWDPSKCGAGQDFIIQVGPFGCDPAVVRSDLLEEQNTPVFCQLTATKINPLIKVEAIDYMSFSGKYPKEVAGVGFHPARAAIKGSHKTLLNSPILENIGYAVIVLKKQQNESAMPDWVEGTLTAKIRYDIENAFGIGRAIYYLPEMDDDGWERADKYKQYGFWKQKGFLRAEGIDDNGATISIYQDKTKRISSVNLKKGETSKKIFIPGFYCMASLQLKLDGLVNPNTRAKLDINGDIVEVAQGEKFLENKCSVKKIEKQGLVDYVELSCKSDSKTEKFSLGISPRIELKIDDKEGDYSIGDKLPSFKENEYVYLSYIGSETGSKEKEDLFVYLYKSSKDEGTKLSDSRISSIAKRINSGLNKKGEKFKKVIKSKEIEGVKGGSSESIFGKNINILGLAGPKDKSFEVGGGTLPDKNLGEGIAFAASLPLTGEVINNEKIKWADFGQLKNNKRYIEVYEEKIKKGYFIKDFDYDKQIVTFEDELIKKVVKNNGQITLISLIEDSSKDESKLSENENYNNAIKDYETIINDFSYEKKDETSQETFGEKAFENAIELAKHFEQFKKVSELCENFKEKYPDSKIDLDSSCSEYQLSNSRSPIRDIMINGFSKSISFEGIYEPTPEEYSADIRIKMPDEKQKPLRLMKNQIFYLNDERTEYIQLISLKENSTQIKFSLTRTTPGGKDGVVSGTKRLLEGIPENFGSKTTLTLINVNLKKQAKVSVIPNIDNAETKANFSFKIGIEKRAIQLSPEQTRDRIESLNDTIKKWEKINTNLGKVVKGLKASCVTVGGFLTLKNFFGGFKGKAGARQEVTQAYREKCVNEGNGGDKLDGCLIGYNNEIDTDIESLAEAKNVKEFKNSDLCDDRLTRVINNLDNEISIKNKEKITIRTDDNGIAGAFESKLEDDGKCNSQFSVHKARRLEELNKIIGSSVDSENIKNKARKERYELLENIQTDYKKIKDKEKYEEDAKILGADGTFFIPPPLEDQIEGTYYGGKYTGKNGEIRKGMSIQGIIHKNDPYYVTLEEKSGAYRIKEVYKNKDGGLAKVKNEKSTEIKDLYTAFIKRDSSSYNNQINKEDQIVRFFETVPYKGLPSIVSFCPDKGWYVKTEQTLPSFGGSKSYQDSPQVARFKVCNVMGDNKISEDDDCQVFDYNTGKISPFHNLDQKQTDELARQATEAIEQVSKQHTAGVKKVNVNVRGCGSVNLDVGSPAVNLPGMNCEDFMSPKDCNLLFNVCDPVICPSSRCNFGGDYPVNDVIGSGIIGSSLLCLPNFGMPSEGGVLVPVCLSGIHAGIDSLLQNFKGYRNCLQENLETGKTTGICDEIHSIYLCEFFWRQATPFSRLIIPRTIEFAFGGPKGGGEYLGVQEAGDNAEKSVNYMTTYYGAASYKAFKARSTDEVGSSLCRNFISARYPASGEFFDALIEPDSPPQYSAWFNEIKFTDATVPPVSQYSVFYSIYAGKDSGVYFNVYLRSPVGSSYFRDNPTVSIASGYIPKGESAIEKKDLTAPSGYQELCVNVNGQLECGFKQVSTSFAMDWVEDQYVKEQGEKKDIKSEKECISGTPSLYSFVTPNIQEGADDYLNPSIYNKGVTRVCATKSPGKATDSLRWVQVGTCDDNMKCWLDKDSVKDAVNFNITSSEALKDISDENLKELERRGFMGSSEFEEKIEEIKEKGDKYKIKLIAKVFKETLFNNQKVQLYFLRGNAYARLAGVELGGEIVERKETAEPIEEVVEKSKEDKDEECKFESAYWSKTKVFEGTKVNLVVEGNENCNGKKIAFIVREKDILSEDDFLFRTVSLLKVFEGNIAKLGWIAEWQDDGLFGGTPEFYFEAGIGSEKITSSNELSVIRNDKYLPEIEPSINFNLWTEDDSGEKIQMLEENGIYIAYTTDAKVYLEVESRGCNEIKLEKIRFGGVVSLFNKKISGEKNIFSIKNHLTTDKKITFEVICINQGAAIKESIIIKEEQIGQILD